MNDRSNAGEQILIKHIFSGSLGHAELKKKNNKQFSVDCYEVRLFDNYDCIRFYNVSSFFLTYDILEHDDA